MSQTPHGPHAQVEAALREAATFAESALDTLLPRPSGPEAPLLEAMRAAALDGADRFHAFLVLQSGLLFGVDRRALSRVAAAVECVDSYAKSSGGGVAGLAGDALLAFAFALLGAGDAIEDPFIRTELVTRLARAAGHGGLIGGAMLETVFAGEGAAAPPLPEISRFERMKTAVLMGFCCEAGALLGHASRPARHALSAYGQDVGLAFQIMSDLAAAGSGSAPLRGPSVVTALGAERARAQALALTAQAVRHLDLFDEKAELLRAAASFVGTSGA